MDVITEEYENLTGSISGKINGNNELILLGDFNAKLEIAHNEVVQKQSRNGNLLQALLETTHIREQLTYLKVMLEHGQESIRETPTRNQ